MPGAPIISTPDLHEGLTRLQAGQSDFDVGGAQIAFSGIPQGLHNVLRDLQESPLGAKANQLESMTIEMVAMLFDFIFDTKDLPDGIKALLARLQIPVLKAAMLDGAFFAKKSHPARLLVNELAPRVHNSGHVTRKACSLSQFDALARILSGVPLIQPTLFSGGWCMGQLLGDVWLAQGRAGGDLDLTVWREFPSVVEVYLYGKSEARAGRKMGHFLVHEATVEAAVATARRFRAALMASGARGVAR